MKSNSVNQQYTHSQPKVGARLVQKNSTCSIIIYVGVFISEQIDASIQPREYVLTEYEMSKHLDDKESELS